MEISSAVERMVLPGGSKLGKNEINDAATLKLMFILLEVHCLRLSLHDKYKASTVEPPLTGPPFFVPADRQKIHTLTLV